MAHVLAAHALLPSMIERKSRNFLITASAAGLLSQIGSAPYSLTKHAAVAFAESFAIAIDKRFGVKIEAEDERNREIFRSVASLTEHIAANKTRG